MSGRNSVKTVREVNDVRRTIKELETDGTLHRPISSLRMTSIVILSYRFTDRHYRHDATRQFCRVGSGGVNWAQDSSSLTNVGYATAAPLRISVPVYAVYTNKSE